MKLTTKARYAVTAMLDLAMHCSNNDLAITLSDIAERQDISLSYLEQLFSKLRRAGLVNSIRGPRGGYVLSKSPDLIDIAQIIDAVEESVDVTKCLGGSDCQSGKMCLTHSLWDALSQKIKTFLEEVTLAELILNRDKSHFFTDNLTKNQINTKTL